MKAIENKRFLQPNKIIIFSIFILIIMFYYISFYPGYMSYDSATQYSQVLSGEWTTISPVIMVALWTLTDKVITGPGGLFLLFQTVFCIGILLFVFNIKAVFWIKIAILVIIIFWPFNLMILPHLWKDVGLIAFMSLSVGLIQLYNNSGKVLNLYLAMFSLVLASLFRFESIVYIVILVIYVSVLILRHYQVRSLKLKATFLSLVVCIFSIFISGQLVSSSNSEKVTLWPTIAIWDLASVSIKINSVLLPSYTVGPDITIEDLSNAVYPWSNIPLFVKTKAGINIGVITPFTDEQYRGLFKVWLSMIIDHPVKYLEHRFEVINDLLRFNESKNKPMSLFFSKTINRYGDEFSVNSSSINHTITNLIKSNIDSVIFKGWLYFLLELIIVAYLLITKAIKNHEFTVVLCLSGITSVLILSIFTPSAEQRYLIWLINSLLFSVILFVSKCYPKNSIKT